MGNVAKVQELLKKERLTYGSRDIHRPDEIFSYRFHNMPLFIESDRLVMPNWNRTIPINEDTIQEANDYKIVIKALNEDRQVETITFLFES